MIETKRGIRLGISGLTEKIAEFETQSMAIENGDHIRIDH